MLLRTVNQEGGKIICLEARYDIASPEHSGQQLGDFQPRRVPQAVAQRGCLRSSVVQPQKKKRTGGPGSLGQTALLVDKGDKAAAVVQTGQSIQHRDGPEDSLGSVPFEGIPDGTNQRTAADFAFHQ